LDWIGFTLPLAAAVIAWGANEWRKSALSERERREERYRRILESSRGFQEGAPDSQKTEFLQEVDLCWLYCGDDVIKAMYAFLDSVTTGSNSTATQRDETFKRLVLAMRNDLWSVWPVRTTKLTAADFRMFKPS